MEYTTNIICSECEFPVYGDIDSPVTMMLNPLCCLVFCDIHCAKKFMEELTPKDIQEIIEALD